MMSNEGATRPPGWYSKEARAERSDAWKRRRQASAERREEQRKARREECSTSDRRLKQFHDYAAARLASLPPRAVKEISKPLPPLKKGKRGKKPKRPPTLAEKWSHKHEGTPQTHEHAERQRHNQGALARLHASGAIDDDQLAYAEEIAMVAEMIESDVAVRTASLETRVDISKRNDGAINQGINRVRLEMAYTRWRDQLPSPKRAVLDMIVGDAIGYTVAAVRYRMHNRKAKRRLIEALDRWPECRAWARMQINAAELAAMQAGLM
jgi:hypothetical protein